MRELNKDDFDGKIFAIKRWGPEELDAMIATMMRDRTDLKELEAKVREEMPLYRIVEPLFP